MQDIKRKVKNYSSNINIIDNFDLNMKLFNAMIFAFVLVLVLYIVFLGNIFLDLAERKRLDTFAYNLKNEISLLETEYLNSSNNINLALSSQMGFREVKPTYVKGQATIGKLTVAKNEI